MKKHYAKNQSTKSFYLLLLATIIFAINSCKKNNDTIADDEIALAKSWYQASYPSMAESTTGNTQIYKTNTNSTTGKTNIWTDKFWTAQLNGTAANKLPGGCQ
jgi:hypothetical protein